MKNLIVLFLLVSSTFVLAQKTSDTKNSKQVIERLIENKKPSEHPIIIIDKKLILTKGLDSLNIDSDRIATINVVKKDTENLIKIYGEQAKNGVIFIELKPEKEQTTKTKKDNVLYLVNGKIATKETIENIDPNNIESVNVIKDKGAMAVYTKNKYDGVILIKLKK